MTENARMSGRIEPQAQPFSVKVSVPSDDLKDRFNQYWEENKDRLDPDIMRRATKGGYRQISQERAVKLSGGPTEFYRPVLSRVVDDFLKSQGRSLLAVTNLSLQDTDVHAVVYLEPEIRWTSKDLPDNFKVTVPKLTDEVVSNAIDVQVRAAQDDNVVLVPLLEGSSIIDGIVAVLDCESIVDGKVWKEGTFINNKWLIDESKFFIPSIKQNILGMKVGETRKFSVVLPEAFGPNTGKTVDMTIRVNQLYKRDMPAIDDDLAITVGFANMASWRSSLTIEITHALKEQRKQIIENSITNELASIAESSPIPHTWMVVKGQELYRSQRDMVRTEGELMNRWARVGSSKDDLVRYFGLQAAQTLITDMVLRSYGMTKNFDGDTALEKLDTYADAVLKKIIMERTELVET